MEYRPKYPESPFLHLADVVNPETALTARESNAREAHTIPLGSLVEVDWGDGEGSCVRLFVTEHTRDCDQTPLYRLGIRRDESLWEYIAVSGDSLREVAPK